ncbi:protein Syg1p [Diutina catenulata]
MKFGESLEDGLVPEWKGQYVDYRVGKKLVKKCTAARREVNAEPATDVTPLLEPLQAAPGYTEDVALEPLPEPMQPADAGRKNRSLWSYSLKSAKDKQADLEAANAEFKEWLDKQLEKVDSFFSERESDNYKRFLLLQDQLYQLKEHYRLSHRKDRAKQGMAPVSKTVHFLRKFELPSLPSLEALGWSRPKQRVIDSQMDANYRENLYRNGQIDTDDDISFDSEAETTYPDEELEHTAAQQSNLRKSDFVSNRRRFGTPYHIAKRQLRQALFEYYRALSLLKSYRVLNRTAFRKITKKYDKSMNTNICEQYMKKVDGNSYFQTSTLLEKLSAHVEELYVAFFDPETNDRKHSLEKLKSISFAMSNSDNRVQSFYGALGSSSFMLGIGVPLFVLAVYTGLRQTLSGHMPEGAYLIQIWAGFFLLVLTFLFFAVNYYVFDRFKINYKFIFEFDMSTALNWKQFLVLPSFAFAFMALVAWFSLHDFWHTKFPGRDWPWIYWGIMMVIFLWPGRHMYAASRKWLQVALWRLLWSGLYPVEFRDFFLGDILCSLTYTMGNISFYFCLYAHHWNGLLKPGHGNENQCGSTNSRLMGFFSSLPSIFRFLQCIRRYMDSGDWFPHLANMCKYGVSIIYYALLSVYRIERTTKHRAAFITFASLNSLYSSAWDLVMDWSLLHPGSKNWLLRDHLFYPYKSLYYSAMVADVLLRFQWIFYAFFNHQIQQSAVTSFCIALAEITRRFIWVFFRMENEHSTNVVLFRASKDTPLPYPVSTRVEKAIAKLVELHYIQHTESHDLATEPALTRHRRASSAAQSEPSEIGAPLGRRKSTLFVIGDRLNKAHIKDFQRRKTTVPDFSDEEEEEDDDDTVPGERTTSWTHEDGTPRPTGSNPSR